MDIRAFQRRIDELYGAKDRARGVEGTFLWLVEETGELSRAVRRGDRAELEAEFADCLAWLSTLANLLDVDLESVALAKYGGHCPKCGRTPCGCAEPSPSHGA